MLVTAHSFTGSRLMALRRIEGVQQKRQNSGLTSAGERVHCYALRHSRSSLLFAQKAPVAGLGGGQRFNEAPTRSAAMSATAGASARPVRRPVSNPLTENPRRPRGSSSSVLLRIAYAGRLPRWRKPGPSDYRRVVVVESRPVSGRAARRAGRQNHT